MSTAPRRQMYEHILTNSTLCARNLLLWAPLPTMMTSIPSSCLWCPHPTAPIFLPSMELLVFLEKPYLLTTSCRHSLKKLTVAPWTQRKISKKRRTWPCMAMTLVPHELDLQAVDMGMEEGLDTAVLNATTARSMGIWRWNVGLRVEKKRARDHMERGRTNWTNWTWRLWLLAQMQRGRQRKRSLIKPG